MPAVICAAFATAMREVAANYPRDNDIATNRAAVQVDEAYLAKEKPAGIDPLGTTPTTSIY